MPASETSPKAKTSTVKLITNNELGPWVLKYHRQFYPSTPAFMVAYLICREYYNHRKGYAFPSIDFLCKTLGYSPRMMKYHIKALRDATDKDGNPLWNIVRGYNISDTGNAANRYYPLFLDEIRQGKPPVADDEIIESFTDNEESEDNTAEDSNETMETLAVPAKKEEPVGLYTVDTLPSYVPTNLDELQSRTFGMVSYEFPDDGIKKFKEDQQDAMRLILNYCANTKDLNESKRKEISATMVKTWVTYPEMDADSFYRRFMVYVLNQLHSEGVNTDIEQDFDAREKGMRMAQAMGISYP